jgi:hypothetical protein
MIERLEEIRRTLKVIFAGPLVFFWTISFLMYKVFHVGGRVA